MLTRTIALVCVLAGAVSFDMTTGPGDRRAGIMKLPAPKTKPNVRSRG